jgi:hypothetical protein
VCGDFDGTGGFMVHFGVNIRWPHAGARNRVPLSTNLVSNPTKIKNHVYSLKNRVFLESKLFFNI